jgi:antitoxin component of MazEF toxin-antitoxin module
MRKVLNLQKVGNSRAVIIPKWWLEMNNTKYNEIQLDITGDKITITPYDRNADSLVELQEAEERKHKQTTQELGHSVLPITTAKIYKCPWCGTTMSQVVNELTCNDCSRHFPIFRYNEAVEKSKL